VKKLLMEGINYGGFVMIKKIGKLINNNMKSLLSIVNPVRSIPHLRIQLPHRSKT